MSIASIGQQTQNSQTIGLTQSLESRLIGSNAKHDVAAAETDTATLSQAAQEVAEFSSSMWSPTGKTGFSMSTYTAQGTAVNLVSHAQSSFSMGKFGNNSNLFKMSGANSPKNMDITFTTASGDTQTFSVDKNTRFIEQDDGSIVVDDGADVTRTRQDGTERNAIIVNLDESGSAIGGSGDDIIFNLGQGATLDGGEGNDVIFSMGDKVTMTGGAGNDLLKVVRDVIHKEDMDTNISESSSRANLGKRGLVGYETGVSVNMDGGDGDDRLESEVKLHDSKISGGDGNDTMKFGVLTSSLLETGTGDDDIQVETAYGSLISCGKGDDKIAVGTAAHSSTIDGGEGNDTIDVRRIQGKSSVHGGNGDDVITVGSAKDSTIDGGSGNDRISVTNAERSVINGGKGDDVISLDKAYSSVISGDEGNDALHVRHAEGSLISGAGGDDDIYVAGKLNIVDGGEGTNSVARKGSGMTIDNGLIASMDMRTVDLEKSISALRGVLANVPLDGPSRHRHNAILSYAENAIL